MARRGANVLGIDLATKALKVAQLHALEAQTPNVEYREVAAEALAAESPAGFDVVTCMQRDVNHLALTSRTPELRLVFHRRVTLTCGHPSRRGVARFLLQAKE